MPAGTEELFIFKLFAIRSYAKVKIAPNANEIVVKFGFEAKKAYLCDMLESPEKELEIDNILFDLFHTQTPPFFAPRKSL